MKLLELIEHLSNEGYIYKYLSTENVEIYHKSSDYVLEYDTDYTFGVIITTITVDSRPKFNNIHLSLMNGDVIPFKFDNIIDISVFYKQKVNVS